MNAAAEATQAAPSTTLTLPTLNEGETYLGAIISADGLLSEMIKSQPELIAGAKITSDGGKELGEFIASLRSQLIAMYSADPR